MKKLAKIFIAATLASSVGYGASAEQLTILHTNDTHSQIDPADDNLGGALRRKVVIDSVRSANHNVLVVDAGDAVQGTLYFTLYNGEVEAKAMNLIGYDIAVMGNHEFDNGIDTLAKNIASSNATWVSTNYDVTATPLDSLIVPYVIKEFGGKRIAFMGINLDPKGMISSRNYPGMKFLDIFKAANSTAWSLRHNERADYVVAITHIGYDDPELADDLELAANSEDIDLIIGAHTHTLIDPNDSNAPKRIVKNLAGKDVIIAQNGKMGKYVGEIKIDLDNLTTQSQLIRIDSRLDSLIDKEAAAALAPYRSRVDSLLNIRVAKTKEALDQQQLANLFGDIILQRGRQLAGRSVDFGLINNGGIRNDFPKGMVSEGHVMMTLPFNNYIEVVRIKGYDLEKIFNKMIERNINGVSSNVEATYNTTTHRVNEVLINGKPLEQERTYTVATIDYLANGGDYLKWFTNGEKIAASENVLARDVINALKREKRALAPDANPRIRPFTR
ncbi:MAG: bifunctional metallophosphatase/5'-nucleotidase [Muribaculaceae bacterium]|nr:bifunctional metallophosphatase/5'-nucleotidase [Muribaculaceae bacterium]